MNAPHFSPDDPQLTAYALGELDETERQQVEARLRDDPAARAAVEAIRATVAQLEAALATEPLPAVKPPAADPYRQRKAKVFSFPRFYYVAGGLAAACFAVLVVRHEPRTVVTESVQYTEVNLPVLPQAVVEAESAKAGPELALPRISAADAMAEAKSHGYGHRAITLDGGIMLGGRDKVALEVQTVAPDKNAARTALAPAPGLGYGVTLAKAKAERGRLGVATFGLTVGEPPVAAEAYTQVAESGFLRVNDHPLSTFSIDVDTASYANVRRFLTQGRRPPVDAVRIEELLNYFPYNYAAPKAKNRDEGVAAPFAASMEVAEAPWAPEHRLVRIGLKGREVTLAARPAANLVFLLDVSGSMSSSNKLPLVKESLRLLMDKLRADDRVAIVTYAGNSGLALPSTPVRRSAEILAALDALSPGGSTNGAMGIHLAYDIAKANFVSDGINRVILCTDGDFNVGVTSQGELTRLITEKAQAKVFLTVLGFGMGNYKDATLEQLANKGNGNYGYIDSRREAEKLLVEQVSGTLVTIAKDVKLQVEFNPAQVAAYRLIGYENRLLQKEDFNNDQVDAGEIGAGHTVTALYEIVPAGAEVPGGVPEVDGLKYRRPAAENREKETAGDPASGIAEAVSRELLTLKIRYKEPAGDESRKLEFPLVDAGADFAAASEDFKFAAAVAGFGMLLRDSEFKGSVTFADVSAWAQAGLADDAGGHRSEFLGLVGKAGQVVQ